MDANRRLIRPLGTAAVGVFLVATVAFGANAIGQAPGRTIDTTLTTSDETTSPATVQHAQPTGTPEPTETAEPAETSEPRDVAEPAGTPEPAETVEGQNDQSDDAAGTPEPTETAEPAETPEPTETAEPADANDDHGDGSSHDGSGSDDSGHDAGGHG